MKKLLYTFLAVSIIFSACEEEDAAPANTNNNNSGNAQLFREIHDQTYWIAPSISAVFKFSITNIFSVSYVSSGDCTVFEETTFYDIDYDGCTYPEIELLVITEDSAQLVFTEGVSSGTPNLPSQAGTCSGDITTILFQYISQNEIKMSWTDGDGIYREFNLIPSTQPFPTGSCSNIFWDFTGFFSG
jgi:hypothetical protein